MKYTIQKVNGNSNVHGPYLILLIANNKLINK